MAQRFPIVYIHPRDLNYKWDDPDCAVYDGSEQERQLAAGTAHPRTVGVLESLRRYGMINYLIVKYKHGLVFVGVGNQRLACLRHMKYDQIVPCRIVAEGTNESVVLIEHPYKPIPS